MRHILLKSTGTHIAVIVLASGILTIPFILFGASAQSDDALDHARWLDGFSSQFWSGVLYPRWLSDMNIGLGSPAFYYYPPVPYWITSLLTPFFSNDAGAWHSLGISAGLAVALSGVFAYLWLRMVADSQGALAGALLYIAGPYHLASDAYVRFAFAELWSFVWMPLILYFVHRYAAGYKGSLVGVTLAYAALVMTHLPTTLIFSLCLLPYGFVLIRRASRLDVFAFTGALLLGVGIGAIYLYPAMAMQPNVFLDRITLGYFSYDNWLMPSSFRLWTEDKIVISLLALDLLLLSVATFVVGRDTMIESKPRTFWLCAATFGFLMMTDLSRPIWWGLTPLQKVQFPFRFGTIMTAAVTALGAIALTRAVRRSARLGWRIAAALLIAVWLPGTIWAIASVWQGFHPEADRVTVMNGTPDVPEYRPRQNEFMGNIDW